MSKNSFKNDLFKVTSPCSQDWEQMRGNEKVRFCDHCALEVNNISAMRRKDALRLVKNSDGRVCVRYIKNPQTNAPVFAGKFHQITRRAPMLAVGAMTAALGLSSIAYAQGGVSRLKTPTEQIEFVSDKDAAKDKADGGAGTLTGTIKDPNDAVVPGATITLTEKETGAVRVTTSNDEGIYEFKNLAFGTYSLKAEASGFESEPIDELEISAADGNGQADVLMISPNARYAVAGGFAMMPYQMPLLQAVSENDTDEIMSLLTKGADVNGKDENYNKMTALFVAVEQGNVATVRTLLEFGAKINARDDERRTPIMMLDDDATPELVQLLIGYGAKIKAVDKSNNNVLHHAVEYADAKVLQILIDEGADVNAQNDEGKTPLMIAADEEDIDCIKVLLNADAKVNLRDKEGKTALTVALENDYKEIADLLIAYGATE